MSDLTFTTPSLRRPPLRPSHLPPSYANDQQTFWFMQAALCDLAPTRSLNPQSFNICQRVLLKCHEIIFADPPPPPSSRSPYSPRRISLDGVRKSLLASTASIASGLEGRKEKKKLKVANVEAVVLGLGLIAGAVGGERALRDMRQVAVLQGQRGGEPRQSLVGSLEEENGEGGSGGADGPTKMGTTQEEDGANIGQESREGSADDLNPDSGAQTAGPSSETPSPATAPRPTFLISSDSPTPPSQSTFSDHLQRIAASTSPSLPIAPHLLRQQSTTDPFSQLDDPPIGSPSPFFSALRPKPLAPSQSTPSLPSLGNGPAAKNDPEELLKLYSPKDQERLLRSHYCRSEVRFLIALEEISNRLLVIPKPARVSALRAELTSLNHMLPAEVCMPTWCESDHGHEKGGETSSGLPLASRASSSKHKAHHRVVRISPGDSVVLNSAERAPYLIHVEVLTGDLDFDPSKRANRDLLKKIVSGEEKKKAGFGGKGAGSPAVGPNGVVGFGGPLPDPLHPLAGIHSGISKAEDSSTVPAPQQTLEPYVLTSASTGSALDGIGREDLPDESEEMDLVEQIYGSKVSAVDIDPQLEDRIPVDLNPKNKDIDLAVWSRAMAIQDASSPSGRRRMPSLTQHLPPVPSGDVGSSSPTMSGSRWADGSPAGSGSASPSLAAPEKVKRQRSVSHQIQSDQIPRLPKTPTRASLEPSRKELSLDDYSDRMKTAAVMLAQLSASVSKDGAQPIDPTKPLISNSPAATATKTSRWFPTPNLNAPSGASELVAPGGARKRLPPAEAEKIRERIMAEMLALEEERVERMTEKVSDVGMMGRRQSSLVGGGDQPMEDESIVRRELNKADPSGTSIFSCLSSERCSGGTDNEAFFSLLACPAVVLSEAWSAKKARIRASSPWGHLATWDVFSVIVKTGADLRQEQLATQLLERFVRIWKEEDCACWMR